MAMGYQPYQRGTVSFGWIQESFQLFTLNWIVWGVSVFVTLVFVFSVSWGLNFVLGVNTSMQSAMSSSTSGGSNPFAMIFAIYTIPMYWVVTLITMAVSSFFYSGLMRMANATVRGQAIDIAMLFQGGPTFVTFFVVNALITFVGGIGLYLCLFPGLVIYGLCLPAFALAADGESIGDSFNKSLEAMKSQWGMAAMFMLVLGLVYIFGSALTCLIGMFATIPMLFLCSSLAYRDMVGMPGGPALEAGYNPYAQQPGQWPPAPGTYQQYGANQSPGGQQYSAPPQQGWQQNQPPQQPPPPPSQQTSTPYMPYAQGQGQSQPPPPPQSPYTPQSSGGSILGPLPPEEPEDNNPPPSPLS